MTSQQMTNFKNGNGFVDNATAARVNNLRASLEMSREGMVSATRGTQAAENGVARGIGKDLRGTSVYPEDVLGGVGSYFDVLELKATSLVAQVGEAIFSPTGTGEMIGRIVGGIGGFGVTTAMTRNPLVGVFGGYQGARYLGNLGSRFDYPGAGSLNYNEWEGYNGEY
jgi:hypothetical protein